MDQSLSSIGRDIYRLLDEVAKKDFATVKADHDEARILNLITHEGQRFRLWAINIGLLVPGHGSLDYRVREADSLARTFRSFLSDLVEGLEELLEFEPYDQGAQVADQSLQDETDELPSEDDTPNLAVYYESIQDIVNRLSRLSVKLRSPSTRLGMSKAAKFRILDGDVDLFQMYHDFDLEHVRYMFHQYHNGVRRLEQDESPRNPKESLPFAEHYLVRRIARANVLRRQQFAYWRHHRLKLARHTDVAVQAARNDQPSEPRGPETASFLPTPMTAPPISISTATHLDPKMLDYKDTGSVMSMSEYTPSSSFEADNIEFPPAPQLASSDEFFECPFCFTTCGGRTARPGAWRAHLIHDMRPYVCTCENCKTPDQLYDSKLEWIQHESMCHQVVRDHSNSLRRGREESSEPFKHPYETISQPDSGLHDSADGVNIVAIVDRLCPMCDKRISPASGILDHMAVHLERLALFSLPRSVCMGEDELERNSNDANVDDHGTQDDTLDQSLNFDQALNSITTELVTASQEVALHDGNTTERVEETSAPVQAGADINLWVDDKTDESKGGQHGSSPILRDSTKQEEVERNHHLESLEERERKAMIYYNHGNLDAALSTLEQVLSRRQTALGQNNLTTLETTDKLGLWYFNAGRFLEADKLYAQAIAGYERLLGPDSEGTLNAVHSLGRSYYKQGRLDEAEQMYSRALAGYEDTMGPDHLHTLATICSLGTLYYEQGRLDEAEQMYSRALAGYEDTMGPDHLHTLATIRFLGTLYHEQGRLDEAEQMYDRVLAGLRVTHGPEHFSVFELNDVLGKLYADQGRLSESEDMYKRALIGNEIHLGSEHVATLHSLHGLAVLYVKQGKIDSATSTFLRVLAGREKTLGPDHARTLDTVQELGRLYRSQANFEEAERMYSKIHAAKEKTLGADHPETREASRVLREVYLERHKLLEPIDELEDESDADFGKVAEEPT